MTSAPFTRAQAVALIRGFEPHVREDEMRGSGHPELQDYRQECYKVARERLIQHLTGNPVAAKAMRMPTPPEIDYDR